MSLKGVNYCRKNTEFFKKSTKTTMVTLKEYNMNSERLDMSR